MLHTDTTCLHAFRRRRRRRRRRQQRVSEFSGYFLAVAVGMVRFVSRTRAEVAWTTSTQSKLSLRRPDSPSWKADLTWRPFPPHWVINQDPPLIVSLTQLSITSGYRTHQPTQFCPSLVRSFVGSLVVVTTLTENLVDLLLLVFVLVHVCAFNTLFDVTWLWSKLFILLIRKIQSRCIWSECSREGKIVWNAK